MRSGPARRRFGFFIPPLLLLGCAAPVTPLTTPELPHVYRDHTFRSDTILEGEVRLSGECLVPRGVTLEILPGTKMLFVPEDRDGDGWGDALLRVEGRIRAEGRPGAPVTFSSAGDEGGRRRVGDWEALVLDFSRGNLFRYVVVEYSRHSIHAHFSEGKIVRSLIAGNNDGCRMGGSSFLMEENLVRYNLSKGLNFRDCANTVRNNEITANGNGIFMFEKDSGTVISGNNIYGNHRYNLRLGDFFRGHILAHDNWWGYKDEGAIRKTIYDSRMDASIGTADIQPAPTPHTILPGVSLPVGGYVPPGPEG